MNAARQENILEIKRLAGLAGTNSREQREFLYNRIGHFLNDDQQTFSLSEKEIMADIICRITADVERSIRANFAKKLAARTDVPKSLMLFLANDEIEVALPILRDCGLLEEHDLLDIVKHRSRQHRLAIAARENLEETVCTALCESGETDVAVTLLMNHSAQMPLMMLEYLGEQSEYIPEYQRPLLERPFLPKEIAEKMYRWVSMSLREFICQNFEVDARLLDMELQDRETTISAITMENDPSARLVEKLHRSGELSPRFMIKSLQQGEVDLFEFAFARLLNMDIAIVRQIIYTDNPEVLAVACRRLEIDRVIYKNIHDLTVSIRAESATPASAITPAPLEFYDLLTAEAVTIALQNAEFIAGKIRYAET